MDQTLKAVLASWQWRPDVALVVAGLAAVYVAGWCRLRRRKTEAAVPWELVLYLSGLAVVVLALLSPLDTFAAWLFTLHMVEHQLLTMVAPPLLLLANPLPVVLWALPRSPRNALGRLLARGALVRRGFRLLTWMPITWPLYDEVGSDGLAHEEDGLEVDGIRLVPVLLAVVGEWHAGRQGHPGIVHQDVDLPQLLPDTLQRGLHVGRPGHVAAHADRLAPDELPDLSSALQECTENLNRIIDVVQVHGSRVVMMGLRRWRASLMGEEVVKLLRIA